MTKKILWLDDEPEFLARYSHELNLHDVEVVAVHTLDQAIEAINEQDFHFFITDLRMPEMNGADAIKAIRQSRPDIEAAVLTAFHHDEELQKAMNNLEKPVSIFSKGVEQDTNLLFEKIFGLPPTDKSQSTTTEETQNPLDFVLRIEGNSITAILDTGSTETFISAKWLFESGAYDGVRVKPPIAIRRGGRTFHGIDLTLPGIIELPGGDSKAIEIRFMAIDEWESFSSWSDATSKSVLTSE